MIASDELVNEDIKSLIKRLRREKEISSIGNAIASGNYVTKRDRIAGILNLYPKCRDNDIALMVKYWQLYQPEFYSKGQITEGSLFKLERHGTVARLRAKIQNDYGLFVGSEVTQRKRRQKEEEFRSDLVDDSSSRKIVTVYADETGKNGRYLILGSLWVLEAKSALTFQDAILAWKAKAGWKGELHFSACSKGTLEKLKGAVDEVAKHRDYLGFKFVATDQSKTSRQVDDLIEKLYVQLLSQGYSHEVKSGRIGTDRLLSGYFDESTRLDGIALDQIKVQAIDRFRTIYMSDVNFGDLRTVKSKESVAVQIADLICGAVNRKLNAEDDVVNHKDELAEHIFERFGLSLKRDDGDDSSTFFFV